MRIDAYTHFMPSRMFQLLVDSGYPDIGKRMREVPCIHDLDARRKVVDTFPDYAQIISYAMPQYEVLKRASLEELGTRLIHTLTTLCCCLIQSSPSRLLPQSCRISPGRRLLKIEKRSDFN